MVVRDRVNRYVNLIALLGFGLYGGHVAVSELLTGHFDGHILTATVASVAASLIAALGFAGLRHSTEHRSGRT